MNKNNNEKIKAMLESEPVPDELSPESIKLMLDKKAPVRKRKSILKTASKFTAAAAAFAVLCGTAVHLAEQKKDNYNPENIDSKSSSATDGKSEQAIAEVATSANQNNISSMNSAEDYSEIYSLFKESAKNYEHYFDVNGEIAEDIAKDSAAESAPESNLNNGNSTDKKDFSDTYNQESGVLEADIAKTDGEYIYYLSNVFDDEYNNKPVVAIAAADNGKFTDSSVLRVYKDIPIKTDDDYENSISVSDMYLYNDKLIVIGDIRQFSNAYYSDGIKEVFNDCCIDSIGGQCTAFVNIYTTGLNPELICSYTQDGAYNDVRITDEGYLYLVTEYSSASFGRIENADDYDEYIPGYCFNGEYGFVPADGIMIPEGGLGNCMNISYSVIGSLGLNSSDKPERTDIKALAGWSGNIYCSGANLYTASGYDSTKITRFSLKSGIIAVEAECEIDGFIKDQFSMSEYNGYFRVAATVDKWEESFSEGVASYSRIGINSCVYVLDMELKLVGKTDSFGENETIKSVSFSGDTVYVVTYEQTDPLFSIDLSNPKKPVLLDDYKLLGYSTYMQQWDNGMLLGFGVSADKNGVENGIKLVMFDNSDPEKLKEIDSYTVNKKNDCDWIFSNANWDRKALLIAPEKNLIGVPVNKIEESDKRGNYTENCGYMFFSFNDGKFELIGEISKKMYTENYKMSEAFDRAVYIDDYIYILSGSDFVSADVNTLESNDIYDRVSFK